VRVPDVDSVQLEGLTPDTAYSIFLFALYGEAASDPMQGVGVTRPLLPAGVLKVSDVTHSSMKLKWDAAPGNVRKYIINYKPDEGDPKEGFWEKEFSGSGARILAPGRGLGLTRSQQHLGVLQTFSPGNRWKTNSLGDSVVHRVFG
ncbi:hypothetical protein CRUP_009534, partial [Coryphaenoides rupestris]